MGALRSQIEERRQLQSRIKELRALLPNVAFKPSQSANEQKFQTNVIVGESLRSFFGSVAGYKKLACFSALQDYLYGDVRDKVFILNGLRRTGKTTLIRQALADLRRCWV